MILFEAYIWNDKYQSVSQTIKRHNTMVDTAAKLYSVYLFALNVYINPFPIQSCELEAKVLQDAAQNANSDTLREITMKTIIWYIRCARNFYKK